MQSVEKLNKCFENAVIFGKHWSVLNAPFQAIYNLKERFRSCEAFSESSFIILGAWKRIPLNYWFRCGGAVLFAGEPLLKYVSIVKFVNCLKCFGEFFSYQSMISKIVHRAHDEAALAVRFLDTTVQFFRLKI